MCQVVKGERAHGEQICSIGTHYELYEEGIIDKTRFTIRGEPGVLICKHGSQPWKVTPELKEGELLKIPASSLIKFVFNSDLEKALDHGI